MQRKLIYSMLALASAFGLGFAVQAPVRTVFEELSLTSTADNTLDVGGARNSGPGM